MLNQIRKFFKEESGQGMTEYGLIIALVAVVLIGVVKLFGAKIKGMFEGLTNNPNIPTT